MIQRWTIFVLLETIAPRYIFTNSYQELIIHLILLHSFITVPTTCSRPSIEMVDFMYVSISPCSLSKSDRIRLRGRT